jgi:soluble lytic murein transglycosylase
MHHGSGPSHTEQLENQLRELHDRTESLNTLQAQLEDLEKRVDGADGAEAYAEAKRLGIIAAVTEACPDLRPSAVRRMGIAIVSEARRNALDPLLLAALAHVESRFNPFVTSGAGARGVLQLTPPTGRTMASMQGASLKDPAELYDVETNVALGARYLADLVRQFHSVDRALLAYNRGIGGARAVLKTDNGRQALNGYPRAVLAERERLAARAAKMKRLAM